MDKTDYYYISHYKETDCEVWDEYVGILVTCKDCMHFEKCSRNIALLDGYQMYEQIDFCSYGERRDNVADN